MMSASTTNNYSDPRSPGEVAQQQQQQQQQQENCDDSINCNNDDNSSCVVSDSISRLQATTLDDHHHHHHHPSCNSSMDDGNTTDALADAFSSSLANIAAAGLNSHYNRTTAAAAIRYSTITNNSDESLTTTTSKSDRNYNTRIGSQSPVMNPAVVTTTTSTTTTTGTGKTTTTSSSDDRGDSSEGNGNRHTNNNHHHHHHHHQYMFDSYTTYPHRRPCHVASLEATNADGDYDDRPHYHRNHHHNHSRRQQQELVPSSINQHQEPVGSALAIETIQQQQQQQQRPDGARIVVAPIPTANASSSPRRFSSSNNNNTSSDDSNGQLPAVVDDVGVAPCTTLLHPYREMSFTNIRQTFYKRRKNKTTDQNDESCSTEGKSKRRGLKRKIIIRSDSKETKASLLQARLSLLNKDKITNSNDLTAEDTSGMNSSSEGGYSASYSSNGSCAADYYDSCNNSLNGYDDDDDDDTTDDNNEMMDHHRTDHDQQQNQQRRQSGDPMRPMLYKKHQRDSQSLSSDIADFSSNFYSSKTRSQSPSLTSSSSSSSSNGSDGDNERTETKRSSKTRRRRRTSPSWALMPQRNEASMIVVDSSESRNRSSKRTRLLEDKKPAAIHQGEEDKIKTLDGKVPIMTLDCDVLAHVLTFLEPPEVLEVLTMPLSKSWLAQFTGQPELWRVLCLLEPFKAQMYDDDDDDSSAINTSSSDDDSLFLHSFSTKRNSKFRLLYASYVRCMKCLARIKEDAMSGRPLSVIDYAAVLEESGMLATSTINTFGSNQNLQQFLARARRCSTNGTTGTPSSSNQMDQVTESTAPVESVEISIPAIDCWTSKKTKSGKSTIESNGAGQSQIAPKKSKIKFGHSKLTQRLIGPSLNGRIGEVELPWSYGIYSIVNWMVAYFDVEGIQLMALRVLPFLLENEQQRITAQRAGLTDIVLRDMVLFPNSILLHTAAFHTIVLLARPLGGQEGMLFHTSMVNSSGIFGSSNDSFVGGKSGIAVLIDSMRRHGHDEALQSMACWSLVNIALAPAQKEVLVKLGAIQVIGEAMVAHQYSAEVQFRALFALINLVIPSVPNSATTHVNQDLGIDVTEREMLDEMVDQIIGLVVLSMKNFCANEAILNRACLVLHNLSLSQSYHTTMLWTSNCYQMLEWCLVNYRTDQVLQQSAAGTLHRLQTTLSKDEPLRVRFMTMLRERQKESIDRLTRDADRFRELQEQQQGIGNADQQRGE